MIYSELSTYSPIQDCDITRISTSDDRGAEYFCIIEQRTGKRWREVREIALDQIGEAIARGDPPGEVTITLDL